MKRTALLSAAAALAWTVVASAQHSARGVTAPPLPPPVPISTPTHFEPQTFDVLHYDVWLDLTQAPGKAMHGVCTMRVHWTGDPQSGPFYFHLRDLTIDSAFYNGMRVAPQAVGTPETATYHYELTPPVSARTGDTANVTIYYGGTAGDEYGSGTWGGVSANSTTLYALGVGFLNNYVSATEHWMPCYDHPSDKATFDGRFVVKQGKTVASNGLLVGTTPGPDSTVVQEWRTTIPTATYLLTFAVDNYFPVEIQKAPLPMVIYARASDTAATRTSFRLLPRMVATFERRFGPYPFEKVGYVNTPVGAMEHQTMVSFPTSLSRSRDTVNSTGAHELSHQWFGDLVTPLDYRHAWLNESFAVYCESMWAEELGGYAGYLKSQEGEVSSYLNSAAPKEGILPLYDFPRTPPSSNYPSTIYAKGAVVLGMLRFELGDSLFYKGIRDYLTAHAYGNATTEELRTSLEASTGRSLGTYFDQWVYGKGWPVINVNVEHIPTSPGFNRVTLTLSQAQADSLPLFTNLPLEFGFLKTDHSYHYRLVRMNARNETITLDSVPDFTTVNLNKGPSVRTLVRAVIVTMGVEESTDQSSDSVVAVEFVVKPNPLSSQGAFTVSVEGTGDCGNIDYELFDSSGRRLLVGHAETCQFPIPSGAFSSGVYVLRFKMNNLLHDVPVMIAR